MVGPLVGLARRLWRLRAGADRPPVHWPLALAGAAFWILLTASVAPAVPTVQVGRPFVAVLVALGTVGVFEQVITRSVAPTVGVITLTVVSALLAGQLALAYAFEPGGAVRLAFPLPGEWHVLQGGRSVFLNHHFHVPGQAYALDLWREGGDGAEVRAPADGEVVRAGDHDLAGEHVVLRIGARQYVLLAHLQRGSTRVAPGTVVAAGDVVGLVGSTGNSTTPHLHIQVQDVPGVVEGRTRPIDFGSGPLRRGDRVRGPVASSGP